MRAWGVLVLGGVALAVAGASLLAKPDPPFYDVPAALAVMVGLVLANVALARRFRAFLPWAVRILAVHVGSAIAVLVLAYKDTWAEDQAFLGPWIALDALVHAVLAPAELALGVAVGFVDRARPCTRRRASGWRSWARN